MLHPDAVSRTFAALVRQSGLPRIRLHDLRHGWASLALEAGIHPKVVSERLGRSAVGITLDTYSHAVQGLDAEAATTVAKKLFRRLREGWRLGPDADWLADPVHVHHHAADRATVDELATRARAARVEAGEVEGQGVICR